MNCGQKSKTITNLLRDDLLLRVWGNCVIIKKLSCVQKSKTIVKGWVVMEGMGTMCIMKKELNCGKKSNTIVEGWGGKEGGNPHQCI